MPGPARTSKREVPPPEDDFRFLEDEAAARSRRLALRAGAAVAAAAALALVWSLGGDAGDRLRYRTSPVVRERLVVSVNATGTLQPTNTVDVGSELSGIVDSVTVDYNDRVQKGQVLAQLDLTKLQAEALQSKAQLDAAIAALDEKRASAVETEAELARMTAVRKASGGRVPSQQDYDAAKAAVARARAAVASAEAQIALSRAQVDFDQTNLAKAVIRSPIDGVVLTREVEPGQTIAASLQAPKLFQLAEDLAKMELEVDVDEADVGQVKEGQAATFTVDAYPERSFPARITQLRYASETVNNVVTYKAVLEVANEDQSLRPGMTATADIVVAVVDDATLMPNEALRFVPPKEKRDRRGLLQKLLPFGRRFSEPPEPSASGTERTVYVLDDAGKPSPLPVRIGLSDGRRTQLVSGDVEAGEELVVDATPADSDP
jgi:HlyD family secretion protein